ncbi:MAG TPA: methyltransferase domain-containing protein [Reyranella sp.]|nr:methyltransferase domain-containing protein [Reyranella sp.]
MVPARPVAGAPSLALDNASLALDYERISATRQLEAGRQLVQELAIRPGERVLDVGCGTGLLAEHIADIVGPEGSVLGVDPLPLRIGLATSRARDNLSFEVADANDLSRLADGSFDVAVLNAVFHWLPDKTGPLLSFRRVLRHGGRLGISTALKGHISELQVAARAVLAEPPFDLHPRPRESITFRVDGEELRALLQTTGFHLLSVAERESEVHHADAAAALRFMEASSFGNVLGHLPVELRDRARNRVREKLAEIAGPGGIVTQVRRLVAIAERR